MSSETKTIRGERTLRHSIQCRRWIGRLMACAAVATLGCDETPTLPPPPSSPTTTRLPATPAVQPQPPPAMPPAAAPAQSAPVVAATPQDGDPTPGADREKAVRGSGVKGRKYGGGVYTEPVRQYFRLQQASVFEIQIPHDLGLFKAEHNRFPKDWAEFKSAILEPASIQLPELPEGERYVFDSKEGELMVERPKPPTEE
jgi:hypothetical protein